MASGLGRLCGSIGSDALQLLFEHWCKLALMLVNLLTVLFELMLIAATA